LQCRGEVFTSIKNFLALPYTAKFMFYGNGIQGGIQIKLTMRR